MHLSAGPTFSVRTPQSAPVVAVFSGFPAPAALSRLAVGLLLRGVRVTLARADETTASPAFGAVGQHSAVSAARLRAVGWGCDVLLVDADECPWGALLSCLRAADRWVLHVGPQPRAWLAAYAAVKAAHGAGAAASISLVAAGGIEARDAWVGAQRIRAAAARFLGRRCELWRDVSTSDEAAAAAAARIVRTAAAIARRRQSAGVGRAPRRSFWRELAMLFV